MHNLRLNFLCKHDLEEEEKLLLKYMPDFYGKLPNTLHNVWGFGFSSKKLSKAKLRCIHEEDLHIAYFTNIFFPLYFPVC